MVTVRLAEALIEPALAVIVARPAPIPVIAPEEVIDATWVADDDHAIVPVAIAAPN